jgi:hypothetical protein
MELNWIQRCALAVVAGALAVGAAQAQNSRAECEKAYKPQVGQSGKDVVWVPTPDELVSRMLTMAKVTKDDYVIDLGAGDGKIAIAAAKNFGARSLGIEYNPDMAKLAQCMVKVEGVGNRTHIVQGDIFKEDFSKASVVTMYLLPELNLCVRHRILSMAPGTRVTSHQFTMGDWEADQTAEIEYRTAYLWIVPARVEGAWALKAGNTGYTVNLTQKFQKLSGDVMVGKNKQPLVGATLRGDEVKFAFNDDKGVTQTFTGRVSGNQLTGTLRAAGGEAAVTGTGTVGKAGNWADRHTGCERFYGAASK